MASVANRLSVEDYWRDGFLGPVRALGPEQCRRLVAHLTSDQRPAPSVWWKGAAATDWHLASLASNRRFLELLTPILGEDIILWAATLVEKKPGEIHDWHVDSESAAPDGRFASLWIGLENCSGDAGLRLIAGSHLCGRTVDQCAKDAGVGRDAVTSEMALEWAQALNPEAHFAEPEVKDGDAILFDGRIWHGSHNRSPETRSALILQFAAADSPVRIPWAEQGAESRAPVILLQGQPKDDANLIVPSPTPPGEALESLRACIRRLELPLAPSGKGWRPYPLFRGTTPTFGKMQCHAAVLSPGKSPHPPHSHGDEELLIVLHGEAELLLAHEPEYAGATAVPVKAGDFIYYPPFQHHTIRNPADKPVTYLMFRWNRPGSREPQAPLKPALFRAPAGAEPVPGRGFTTRRVMDRPARWLQKLHCHRSRLEPGAGYAAHADPYDIAIFMQRGQVRILGQDVGPGALVYIPAGDLHGIRNMGDEAAEYLVWEFHPQVIEDAVQDAPAGLPATEPA